MAFRDYDPKTGATILITPKSATYTDAEGKKTTYTKPSAPTTTTFNLQKFGSDVESGKFLQDITGSPPAGSTKYTEVPVQVQKNIQEEQLEEKYNQPVDLSKAGPLQTKESLGITGSPSAGSTKYSETNVSAAPSISQTKLSPTRFTRDLATGNFLNTFLSAGPTQDVIQKRTIKQLSFVDNKGINLRPTNLLTISYEMSAGDSFTKQVRASDYAAWYEQNKQYNIYKVTKDLTGEVVYQGPTLDEYQSAYEKELTRDYQRTGIVPLFIRSNIVVPEDVKYLGLSNVFIRESYEEGLGLNVRPTIPKDFVGPVKFTSDFEKAYTAEYEKLPDWRKFEMAVKWGDLKDLAVEKYPEYKGGATYILRDPRLVEKYAGATPVDMSGVSAYMETGRDPYTYEYGKYFDFMGIKSSTVTGVTEKYKLWQARAELKSGQHVDEYYFSQHSPLTRAYSSFFHAAATSATFPITLTQTGVKYLTGEGAFTDVLGRIKSGKTFLPDFGRGLQSMQPGGPSGLIATGIGEGISAVTGEESRAWYRFQKDPISGIFATGGEVLGLYGGGSMLRAAKNVTMTGLGYTRSALMKYTGWNIPGYTTFAKYSPVNLIRTGYYKYLEKTGRAIRVEPETIFQTSALPNKLSYAPGSTPAQRISATFSAFEKRAGVTTAGEEFYTGVHSTTSPWLKPFVWMRKGRESPGVSFAPLGEGSPRFLRIGGFNDLYDSSATGFSLLPKIKLRTAPLLHFKELVRIPKTLRGTVLGYKEGFPIVDISKANLFMEEYGSGVFVAPKMYFGGGEYEVIARGVAHRLGVRYFTQIEGITIPLPEFTLGEFNFGNALSSSIKEFASPVSSYGSSTIPIINPSYIMSQIGYAQPKFSKYAGKSIRSIDYSRFSSLDSSILSSYLSSGSSILSSLTGSSIASSIRSSLTSGVSSSIPSIPSYPSPPSSSIPSLPSLPSPPSYSIDYVLGSSTPPPPYKEDKYGKREQKLMKKLMRGVGYRERTWKVPTMESILKGGIV